MVHNNALTIQFIGHYVMVCEDPANTTLWARVHRSTYLDIQGDLLPLADDLKQLPMPFLDPAVMQPLSLPVVFASAPSMKAIQAAGIVTSYFGMISENRPVRFPVHIGAIPPGNAIVISDNPSNLPAGPEYARCRSRPPWRCAPTPIDPFGKVLVIAGQDADQTMRSRPRPWHCTATCCKGRRRHRQHSICPASRRPTMQRRAGRAPTRHIALWDYATADQLQGDGSAPLSVYFRIRAGHLLQRAAERRSSGSSIATIPFPSGPFPACRSASTTPFSARCR